MLLRRAEAESFKREYDQQLQELENRRRRTEQEVQQEAMIMRDDIFKKSMTTLQGIVKKKDTHISFPIPGMQIFFYTRTRF